MVLTILSIAFPATLVPFVELTVIVAVAARFTSASIALLNKTSIKGIRIRNFFIGIFL
jgi:hypothetical protein